MRPLEEQDSSTSQLHTEAGYTTLTVVKNSSLTFEAAAMYINYKKRL